MIYFVVYQIYRSKSVGVLISDGRSQKNLPDFTESASTCCSVRPETPATRLTGQALRVTTDGTYRRSTSTTWMYFRWVNNFTALVNFFYVLLNYIYYKGRDASCLITISFTFLAFVVWSVYICSMQL